MTGSTESEAAQRPGIPGSPRQHLEADLLAKCMGDRGFPSVRDGIGVGFTVHDDQRPAYEQALADCSTEVDTQLPPAEVFSDEEFYWATVRAGQCLEGLGYEISSPPSEDAFVESLRGIEPPWSPYLDLPLTMSMEEWRRVNEACPQPGLN